MVKIVDGRLPNEYQAIQHPVMTLLIFCDR